ncbi:MAG: DedA family protein, partial [Acidobacteria bacterium]
MPEWILQIFEQYGYWAVFLGVMLENAGLPVPGETML